MGLHEEPLLPTAPQLLRFQGVVTQADLSQGLAIARERARAEDGVGFEQGTSTAKNETTTDRPYAPFSRTPRSSRLFCIMGPENGLVSESAR